jgi:hypothetical protein
MYIYVSSLMKYKMHLRLHDYVKEHLHYVIVEFKMQIYIYVILLEIAGCTHELDERPSTHAPRTNLIEKEKIYVNRPKYQTARH